MISGVLHVLAIHIGYLAAHEGNLIHGLGAVVRAPPESQVDVCAHLSLDDVLELGYASSEHVLLYKRITLNSHKTFRQEHVRVRIFSLPGHVGCNMCKMMATRTGHSHIVAVTKVIPITLPCTRTVMCGAA
jgi:hypothetical protein